MDHILDTDSLITGEDVYLPKRVLTGWLGGFGICQICNQYKKLQVDHDHNSDDFRGMICRECNLGLGLFSDSVEFLLSAISYLNGRNSNAR